MFLEVKDLTKVYQQKNVLHQLSFGVETGEMLVVLGPSGCGKSTLLSCLNGFTQVTSGTVRLLGQEITKAMPEDRDITTVFQSYSLFPHMNVLQNLMYGLKFQKIGKKAAKAKAIKMLQLLQMTEYQTARIQDLSGGQQQRIALGRSLIVAPKLLLLDEPFSNLDEKLRLSMRLELRRLQKELGITMVFVTHDQQEAFAIADRILVMDAGKIQQIATGAELYNQPKNKFVLTFIGEANQLANTAYVRPECIDLRLDTNGQGQIIQKIFQGATINYQVKLPTQTFWITRLNRGAAFEVGDLVTLTYQVQQMEGK
ncbi:ABC transporter ATP-binding protein [Agrilactobacillus yilanensis]|uniref:ABC transporter ATP-binding protein n=1 Tax=Agrilactobacillus yilanensis TaxID=2485997 RepID=A0ABW4J9D7_9LACO|nr:ABC transporter ATP-binding protein [Agrilactobacillus yilanensis]